MSFMKKKFEFEMVAGKRVQCAPESVDLKMRWSKRSSFNVAEVRGEWAKDGMKLIYVWGKSESRSYGERRQPWMNDYEEATTRLGGRRANIRSFSSVTDGKRTYQAELNVDRKSVV